MAKVNKRILVVDNDNIFSESVKVFFEERDYAISVCDEAKEFLTYLLDFRPDVVILDLKIGSTSGFDLLKQIRSRNKNVKVIILTGSPDPKKIETAQELGADEYLIKPVSMSDLRGVIDKL